MSIRILIAEDDAIQAGILADLFDAEGFSVEVANDGAAAMAKLSSEAFEVALIDYRMPEMDGLAVAAATRDLLRSDQQPGLIALTASPRQLREQNGDAVFDAVESKPVDLRSLLATVRRCLPLIQWRLDAARPAADAQTSPAPRDTAGLPSEFWPADDAAAPLAKAHRRARILIVDDDEQVCHVLKSALQYNDFEVAVASNGFDAFRLIEATPFDAVVLDHQMPDMSGLSTARMVATAIRRTNPSRLVAFTASPERMMEEDRDSTRLFDAIVSKSDGIPALLTAVKQRVEYREWRETLYPQDSERHAASDLGRRSGPS